MTLWYIVVIHVYFVIGVRAGEWAHAHRRGDSGTAHPCIRTILHHAQRNAAEHATRHHISEGGVRCDHGVAIRRRN